jgi:hypothetical protein
MNEYLMLLLRVVFSLFVIGWFFLGCVGLSVFLKYWIDVPENEHEKHLGATPRRSPVHVPESVPELPHAVPGVFYASSRRVH